MTAQERQMVEPLQGTIAALSRQLEHANEKNVQLMQLVSQQSRQIEILFSGSMSLPAAPGTATTAQSRHPAMDTGRNQHLRV